MRGKNRIRLGVLPFFLFSFWVLTAARQAGAVPLRVFVTIPPQKYFVQKIGGDRVQVMVLVPPGADPHTYEPKPSQMRALARSDLYFTVGIETEKHWLPKIRALNPKMVIVHTEEGLPRSVVDPGPEHAHKGGRTHPRETGDPHVWLAPSLVKKQADHILSALMQQDPERTKSYQARHQDFVREVEALDRELKGLFSGLQGPPFLVFHPSWGYFAREYGLRQISIEVEGKDPKAAHIQKIIREARSRGIRVVFAQPQFSPKKAEVIAREIGGSVVLLDPLAEDWLNTLRRAARAFREGAGRR